MFDFLKQFIKKKDTLSEESSFQEVFEHVFGFFPAHLKKAINIDESDRKDYLSQKNNIQKYVHNICDSLQLVGISYLKYRKDTSQYSDKELRKGTGQLVAKNFEMEARLQLRRVMEAFLDTKNFKNVKSSELETAIRKYHLIRALQAYYQKYKDTSEFMGLQSNYLQNRVNSLKKEILPHDFFYSNKGKDFNRDGDIKDLLKKFPQLLRETLSGNLLNETEKEILGTYQQYAETSNVIHNYSGLASFNLDEFHTEINALYARMYVLGMCILRDLETLSRPILPSSPEVCLAIRKFHEEASGIVFNVGDIVWVRKKLKAAISKVHRSKYGFNMYEVSYLEKMGDFTLGFEEKIFNRKDLKKIDSPS